MNFIRPLCLCLMAGYPTYSCGKSRSEWLLPKRLEVVLSIGPTADRKVDFKAMKERGYEALGWDVAIGKPLESTLKQLGLKELVGELPCSRTLECERR